MSDTLIERIMTAAGDMPSPRKYRGYLSRLKTPVLIERAMDLEAELSKPVFDGNGKKKLQRILSQKL